MSRSSRVRTAPNRLGDAQSLLVHLERLRTQPTNVGTISTIGTLCCNQYTHTSELARAGGLTLLMRIIERPGSAGVAATHAVRTLVRSVTPAPPDDPRHLRAFILYNGLEAPRRKAQIELFHALAEVGVEALVRRCAEDPSSESAADAAATLSDLASCAALGVGRSPYADLLLGASGPGVREWSSDARPALQDALCFCPASLTEVRSFGHGCPPDCR
jgi:hypothetical protein